MDVVNGQDTERARHLIQLTRDWGAWPTVSLYLDRCQVDTPDGLVEATWKHVHQLRSKLKKVVDFGAGDGRFAKIGHFDEYIGYEIDRDRCRNAICPTNAHLINKCAFSDEIADADLCIGNPPFVRNQDLPEGWRQRVSSILHRRIGVAISGLANAWQYFFLLSLASVKSDGLVALVIPYEWVSRPSAAALREHIKAQRWDVSVYRLVDTTFNSVLTTSSITIVDKASQNGSWKYFEETSDGKFSPLTSPSGSELGVMKYLRRSDIAKTSPKATRGLSPGTQKVLTLTEGERVRSGLMIGRDVVPCVTSLRHVPLGIKDIDETIFRTYFRTPGQKCWLIRTDEVPHPALMDYLNAVSPSDYQTSTCLERKDWWKFTMPSVPAVLLATSFKGEFPKALRNIVGARAVGGVCGIYNVDDEQASRLTAGLEGLDIRDRIVAHSNGLRKIEINQLNSLLSWAFPTTGVMS